MLESLAQEILAKIKPAQRICLVMHQRPDADALGSAAAFGAFLTVQKISFMYYCKTGFPQEAGFFGLFNTECPAGHSVLNRESIKTFNPDLIISFDSGDLKHAGLEEVTGSYRKLQEVTGSCLQLPTVTQNYSPLPFIINFDHHSTNSYFGNINIIETQSASTTEIIYHFFQALRFPISTKIAAYLLAGILIDTDHFSNPATSASALTMAGELLAQGVSLTQIRQILFERRGMDALRLIGEILTRLRKNEYYGIALTYVDENDLKKYNLNFEELEGITNILNSVGDAKAMFLLKANQGVIKISMRTTREDINIGRLAELFGGGGHRKAAGFSIKGTLQKEGEYVRIV